MEDPSNTYKTLPRMIAPDEALRLVSEAVLPLEPRVLTLPQAAGLQLAEAVKADRDYPAFDRSMMDGYAVRLEDVGGWVEIAGEVAAGGFSATPLSRGRCVRIMTGAPCPAGSEAVVPQEDVTIEEDRVRLPPDLQPQQNLARAGSECRAGQVVLEPGQTLTPLAVAVLASFGVTEITVTPRPSLAVITTGAELIDAGSVPQPGQIRDSNGPMVIALACELGLDPPLHRHAEDTLGALRLALDQTRDSDLVLLTGGVSVGRYDHVPAALEACGASPVFHKVRQKPGKPLLFAKRGNQLFFGLPGNPLAAHFCFHRYVAAAIRRLQALPAHSEPLSGQLTEAVARKPDRTYFVPACAENPVGSPDRWQLRPIPGRTSADVFACAGANCYIEVPPGQAVITGGSVVRFTWIARRR